MTEQLISLETAKLAKEKGFDWPTGMAYDKCDILCTYEPGKPLNYNTSGFIKSAPTQALLQKWLRDKKGVLLTITEDSMNLTAGYWEWNVTFGRYPHDRKVNSNADLRIQPYNTYEEALEAGLKESLELL